MKTAIFAAVNLYLMAADWWNELEPYKRGCYQGYVMFEVVLPVVAGVITAPFGRVGAAATLARRVPLLSKLLTHLGPKLRAMNSKLAGQLDPLISKLDEMLSAITGARAGSWCFVAGTMIMTAQGAVPIEQIREGDLVWSSHEETGETGLRPVIELYRNEAEEIWTVRYAGTEDGAPVRELRCTGEHPFWSETERSFVSASELKPGGELRLFGGEAARVVSVTPHRGPPGVKTRVYNFAVAEHHTYFAGDGGVWVHNVCPPGLDKTVAKHKAFLVEARKRLGDSVEAWDEAFEETIIWLKSPKAKGEVSDEDIAQILGHLEELAPVHGTNSWKAIHDAFGELVRPGAKEKVFRLEIPTLQDLPPFSQIRRVDDYDPTTFTIFEFNTTPWASMTKVQFERKLNQITADGLLLQYYSPNVKKAVWYATEPLPSTGYGGQLAQALSDYGIEFIVRPVQ